MRIMEADLGKNVNAKRLNAARCGRGEGGNVFLVLVRGEMV